MAPGPIRASLWLGQPHIADYGLTGKYFRACVEPYGGLMGSSACAAELLRETCSLLEVFQSSGASGLKRALEPMRAMLEAEHSATFSLSAGLAGIRVDFVHTAGFKRSDASVHTALQGWCDSHGGRWVVFDPLRVDDFQTNRAVTSDDLRRRIPGFEAQARGLHSRFALERKEQLRMLIYAQDHFLGWVGAFREEPWGKEQTALLGRLTPVLKRRLLWEHRIAAATLQSTALESLMEFLAGPAFILAKRSHIVFSNQAGRSLLAANYRATCERIRAALAGQRARELQTLRLNESGDDWLVFEPLRGITSTVRRAKLKWELTERQTEVAAGILRGLSNKQIATELGITENTVEYHVTRLLQSAGAGTRAEFAARACELV